MIITRRAASSTKSEEADDGGATNSVESAVKDKEDGRSLEKLGKEKTQQHLVIISRQSLKTCLIWGSLLCIGYQLGLSSSCRQKQSLETTPLSNNNSIRSGRATSNKKTKKPPTTLKQIYDARNCESYLAQTDQNGKRIDSKSLPIYTEEQWQQFRQLWVKQGGKNVEKIYKKSDKRRSKAPPDFVPPFKAGQTSDGKGRGVFATRDIKKGEMIYGLSKNYIFFKSGNDYRRFLDALDDEKACDLMKFTWPQENIGKMYEVMQ